MSAVRNVILLLPKGLDEWEVREAHFLLESAGYRASRVIRYRRVSRSRLLSKAKLEELKSAVEDMNGETKIVVYDEIRPPDYMAVVESTRREVIDRVLLILEVFALHAGSREAKLQIELATLRHRLPIIREAVRRAKMRELPGFLGPGGYAIDAYYRHVVSRIARIRRELEKLRKRREREREKRRSAGLPHVALVGYASAGKTSLFNAITGERKPVDPRYFTTITPKVKSAIVAGSKAVFIDTVGFISNIPPEIIEAFHATLEEIAYSDIIVFVLDVSDTDTVLLRKLDEGLSTLRRIGVVGRPLIPVLNKIDLVQPEEYERKARLVEAVAREGYPIALEPVLVSAKSGAGLGELLCTIGSLLRGMDEYTC